MIPYNRFLNITKIAKVTPEQLAWMATKRHAINKARLQGDAAAAGIKREALDAAVASAIHSAPRRVRSNKGSMSINPVFRNASSLESYANNPSTMRSANLPGSDSYVEVGKVRDAKEYFKNVRSKIDAEDPRLNPYKVQGAATGSRMQKLWDRTANRLGIESGSRVVNTNKREHIDQLRAVLNEQEKVWGQLKAKNLTNNDPNMAARELASASHRLTKNHGISKLDQLESIRDISAMATGINSDMLINPYTKDAKYSLQWEPNASFREDLRGYFHRMSPSSRKEFHKQLISNGMKPGAYFKDNNKYELNTDTTTIPFVSSTGVDIATRTMFLDDAYNTRVQKRLNKSRKNSNTKSRTVDGSAFESYYKGEYSNDAQYGGEGWGQRVQIGNYFDELNAGSSTDREDVFKGLESKMRPGNYPTREGVITPGYTPLYDMRLDLVKSKANGTEYNLRDVYSDDISRVGDYIATTTTPGTNRHELEHAMQDHKFRRNPYVRNDALAKSNLERDNSTAGLVAEARRPDGSPETGFGAMDGLATYYRNVPRGESLGKYTHMRRLVGKRWSGEADNFDRSYANYVPPKDEKSFF